MAGAQEIMEALIEYFRNLDSKFVMVLASVLFLWIFARALRWIIKFSVVVAVVFVVVWKVPAVHDVFWGFIK